VLLGQAGISLEVLTDCTLAVPSECYLRLWELVGHHFDASRDLGLYAGEQYVCGQLGLYDYACMSAPTTRAGTLAAARYMDSVSTNVNHYAVDESGATVDLEMDILAGESLGRDLATQCYMLGALQKARQTTGQPIELLRVSLRQPPPTGPYRQYVELFGATEIEFDAPADRITMWTADLDLPLRTHNPVVAQLVAQHISAPIPTADNVSWTDRVHRVLVTILDHSPVTLDDAAHALTTSRRSLQRRLTEEGTTWRTELDRARRAKSLDSGQTLSTNEMIRRAGYSDARALRRALRRWQTKPLDQRI
jgi:AraC-like DNA-binding protein